MRDRSPRETRPLKAGAGASDRLASFIVDQRSFQVVRCHHKHTPHPAEITRFNLGGLTLAIVEDQEADKPTPEAREIIAKLTGRELQIAAMVAQGYATKNIAYKLRISEWTVGTYLQRIFAKLHVHNRAAMVYRCASLMDDLARAASARSNSDALAPTVARRRQPLPVD
jgi:DNA-binding CsgD family transcriptional regulator